MHNNSQTKNNHSSQEGSIIVISFSFFKGVFALCQRISIGSAQKNTRGYLFNGGIVVTYTSKF